MTGAAEIVARLEALGTVLALGADGRIDADAPAVPEAERLLDDLAAVSADAKRLLRERHAHPCVACQAETGGPEALYCAPCWEKRGRRGRVLTFDPKRRDRTLAALAERYCAACGFSFWAASPRGDASCYACDLIREGKLLRCARCGGEEWRRDEHGRRACATCHGGDGEVTAPSAIAPPGRTSSEFPAPRGAA